MAVIVQCTCLTCGKGWQGCASSYLGAPNECSECRKERSGRERREHFGALDALTVEERLRKVETWIYEYRPPSTDPITFG